MTIENPEKLAPADYKTDAIDRFREWRTRVNFAAKRMPAPELPTPELPSLVEANWFLLEKHEITAKEIVTVGDSTSSTL